MCAFLPNSYYNLLVLGLSGLSRVYFYHHQHLQQRKWRVENRPEFFRFQAELFRLQPELSWLQAEPFCLSWYRIHNSLRQPTYLQSADSILCYLTDYMPSSDETVTYTDIDCSPPSLCTTLFHSLTYKRTSIPLSNGWLSTFLPVWKWSQHPGAFYIVFSLDYGEYPI